MDHEVTSEAESRSKVRFVRSGEDFEIVAWVVFGGLYDGEWVRDEDLKVFWI